MYASKQQAHKAYTQVNISSEVEHASPHRLISMLFEGALRQLAIAKGAISRQDVPAKGLAIGKAIAIVGELQNCLTDTDTNEVSKSLMSLYDYVLREMLDANLHSSEEKINHVALILGEIKQGWDAIPEDKRNAIKQGS